MNASNTKNETGQQPSQQPGICVYCASSTKLEDCWYTLARETGRLIAERGYPLVWGGGSVGMMGHVAQGVHENKGRVIGVIPQFMIDKELAYGTADELIVTDTMRQRKQAMEDRAAGFIVLPGGFGTLEEFFEILTLRILDCHAKPIVILNHDGFYDRMLAFIEQLYEHAFANRKYTACYHVAMTAEEAMTMIEQHAGVVE